MIYVMDADLIVRSLLINSGPDACHYFDDEMKETIQEGAVAYEFSTLGTHDAAGFLSSTGYIARANLRGELLLFKIRSIQEQKQADGQIIKRVFAENAALELIHDIVRPSFLVNYAPRAALDNVLQGTDWRSGAVEWFDFNNFEFTDYPTVLSAIHTINETFGGEVLFRVEIKNGVVTGRFVDLLRRRGQEGTFRFDYKHDIQEIERTEDASLLVTALIGVGNGNSNQSQLTMAGQDFTGELPDGTKVYKPPAQDFVENPKALQRFGTRGRHKFGVFKTDETDRLALIKRTWAELMTYSEPQLQYAVNVAVLSRLAGNDFNHKNYEIGDGGDVIDHSFAPALMVSARIIERTISFTDPSRDAVVLGNFVRYEPSPIQIIDRLQDTIRRNAAVWEQGGEMMHKGDTPPLGAQDLDLWLDTSQIPHVLKKYDAASGQWIKASPTEAGEIGAVTPGEVWDIADEVAKEAEKNANETAKNYVETSEAATRDFIQKNYKAQIIQQATPPASPSENDLWIDISNKPHVWKRWDGSEWVKATITSLDELAGKLKEGQIERGAVTEDALKDGSVSSYKIALNAIIANRIADRAISTEKLATGAVTGIKIVDEAITDAKLAAGAVTPGKIQNGAITSEKLADLAVEAAKLADSAVTAEKIANAAIGTAAIQDAAITNAKIAEIDAGKITTGYLNAGRVQIGEGTKFEAGYDPKSIEVGGRNLAQRTNEAAWNSYYSVNVTFLTDAQGRRSIRAAYMGGTIWGIQQIGAGRTMQLEMGKQYTISYEVRGTPGLEMNYTYVMNNGAGNEMVSVSGQPLQEETFTRYTGTFTKKVAADSSYLMIGNRNGGAAGSFFEIRNVKVEAGNKATDWTPSPEDTTAEITSATGPLKLWRYEDTTYIDGGSIYANTITANQIAAGAIGADQIEAGVIGTEHLAAGSITAEKIATGAFTADNIAAGSITSRMIAADGLDAGVIKFGTMSGARIQSNTLDANTLKAGSVIANNIWFSGKLNGATGTFSGSVSVGSETSTNGMVTIQNGEIISRKTFDYGNGATERTTTRIAAGSINFETVSTLPGDSGTFRTQITPAMSGLYINNNVSILSNEFKKNEIKLNAQGPIDILSNGGYSGGNEMYIRRSLTVWGNNTVQGSASISGSLRADGNLSFYGSEINFYNRDASLYMTNIQFSQTGAFMNPTGDVTIAGGNTRQLTVSRYAYFTQQAQFAKRVDFVDNIYLYGQLTNYNSEMISGARERGYCGVGGIAGGSANIAGVGVNYRIKKNYTPTYIQLTPSTSTATAYTTDLSNEGFFLYIVKPSNAGSLYYYWRGNYYA